MRVADVMTGHVHTCRPTETLHAVMQLLWDHDLGALPVVDEAGRPIAIVTDRDVAMAAFTQGLPLHQLRVESCMSKVVFTAHVADRLGAAERTMRLHQVHRLPVVDESSRLVGLLSLNDIARARVSSAATRPAELGDLVKTVAAIARRRGALTVEEYAAQHAAQHMVSFDGPVRALPAPKHGPVKAKRSRARPEPVRESGIFPAAAAAVLAEVPLQRAD